MKSNLLLGLLIIVNPNIAAAQQTSLVPTVEACFHEVKRVTAKHRDLWDHDLYAPILLIDPGTRQVYANSQDSAHILKQNGGIFTGTLPDSINIANTSVRWSGIYWAMVMLPLPKDKNDMLNLVTHELFHRAQRDLGFRLYNADNNHLDQKEGRMLLRLELEALKHALLANSPKQRMNHLIDAFTFRYYRYVVYPDADSTENILELNEGLAEYTGVIMSGRDQSQMRNHFVETLGRFVENPTYVRSFPYQTTPLYGYLLGESTNGWNKDVTSTTNLTDNLLRAFHIRLTHDLKGTVAKITNEYDGQRILSEETEREERIEKLKAEYKQALIDQPHLTIHLQNMHVSFDPRNIMPLEDKGTVYPNLRITDNWGILTVSKRALLSPTWNSVTVTVPIRFDSGKVEGDGWTLELKPGFVVLKDSVSNNYLLIKR